MSWGRKTRDTVDWEGVDRFHRLELPENAPGWGDMAWGDDAWGSPALSRKTRKVVSWSKASEGANSFSRKSRDAVDWEKE